MPSNCSLSTCRGSNQRASRSLLENPDPPHDKPLLPCEAVGQLVEAFAYIDVINYQKTPMRNLDHSASPSSETASELWSLSCNARSTSSTLASKPDNTSRVFPRISSHRSRRLAGTAHPLPLSSGKELSTKLRPGMRPSFATTASTQALS